MSLVLKKQTCLVTGGAGFIGCAISSYLAQRYGRVYVFDNLHPQVHASKGRPARLASEAALLQVDICNKNDWDSYLPKIKPDVVIHLAAETGTSQSLTEASRHASVNVVGTTQMLDAFVRNNIFPQKLLLTSSRAVYGEGAWRNVKDGVEFYPGQRSKTQLEQGVWDFANAEYISINAAKNRPAPTSVYGATKLAQEHIMSAWAASFGVELAIVRLQNVYGPGQSLINSYTGIVSLFARIAREGKSIPLYEDGAMLRDFILIDDVASAIMQALILEKSTNKIFDIGSGSATTIAEVAQIIAKRYNAPEPHVCGKFRNGDVRHAACDISATKEDLKWKPLWNLKDGLNYLCDWIDQELNAKEN